MMYCADCDENLDGLPDDACCPSCGCVHRNAKTSALLTTGVVAMAAEVSVAVASGDHRPWFEKWLTVRHCLDRLRTSYQTPLGNLEAQQTATSFFSECYHVRDWLKGTGIAQAKDIQTCVDNSVPPTWCAAICNTHKHHTRSGKTDITARMRDALTTPTGARITYEIHWATPEAIKIDALDLAEQCVEAWQGFFRQQGITEP